MFNKVKQGQTHWKVVVYDPGKIEGYDDCHVGVVYPCYITKVNGDTIHYTCGDNDHYICRSGFWKKQLHTTFRKAVKDMQQQISNINKEMGYV